MEHARLPDKPPADLPAAAAMLAAMGSPSYVRLAAQGYKTMVSPKHLCPSFGPRHQQFSHSSFLILETLQALQLASATTGAVPMAHGALPLVGAWMASGRATDPFNDALLGVHAPLSCVHGDEALLENAGPPS